MRTSITLALAALTLIGCAKSEDASTATAPSTVVIPASLLADAQPEGAVAVADAKPGAKVGEQVVIRGRIGGSAAPFASDRAMFTIVGAALPTCADNPEDSCTTPWDYCCETRADITHHAATVRVVDDGGAPLRATMKGWSNLHELSEIIVVGEVHQIDGDVLVIDARQIYPVANAAHGS